MANIHSLNIGGSTYVIEPNLINVTAKTSGMSYVAFFNERQNGGRYAYSYYGAFLNNTTGEMQIPHLRLKHTNGNYGSYLSFGDGNYAYIFENPDDKLNIFSSEGTCIMGGPTYISSRYTYVNGGPMYFYRNILPINDSYSDIGSSDKRFSTIYADTFNGNFNGAIYVTYNPSSINTYSVPFMDYGHSQNSKIYSDNTFNYNPSTNTLTATNFAGTATNATNAENSEKVLIYSENEIKENGICQFENEIVPILMGGCGCSAFVNRDQSGEPPYFHVMTNIEPSNPGNSLHYNLTTKQIVSDLDGNATTATTATNANNVKVTATSTSANYPLILGPSTTAGGTVGTGNKSLYTDSTNLLYYNPSTNTLTAPTLNGTASKISVKASGDNFAYNIALVPSSGSVAAYVDNSNGLRYNPYTNALYPYAHNVTNLGRTNTQFKEIYANNSYITGIKNREIYSYIKCSEATKDTCLIKIATINCRTIANNWDFDSIEIPVYIRHLRSTIYLELTIEHNGNTNPDQVHLRYKGNLRSTSPGYYKGIKFWCSKVESVLTIWCEYGLDNKGGTSMNDPTFNIYNFKHSNSNIIVDLPTTSITYNGTLAQFKSSYTLYEAAPSNIEVANVISSATNFCYAIAAVSSSQYNNLAYKDPNTLYLII